MPDAVLERAADAVRFPRVLVQPALRAIRSYRAATRGWSRVDRVKSETFFADLLAWSGAALEAIFMAAAPAPPQRVRAAPSAADRVLSPDSPGAPARHRFADFDPPLALDCAQVSLDLALLWLEQGRTAETRSLAEEMAWIFSNQGVHREALAALRVFCAAAKQESATVELTRS